MATSTTKHAILIRLTEAERAEIKEFWHKHQYVSESQAVRAAIKSGMRALNERELAR